MQALPNRPMNVQPVPTLDQRLNDIRMKTAEIVNSNILPNESKLWAFRRDEGVDEQDKKDSRDLRREIQGRSARPGCGRRTCPRNTAAWGSSSCRTRT